MADIHDSQFECSEPFDNQFREELAPQMTPKALAKQIADKIVASFRQELSKVDVTPFKS